MGPMIRELFRDRSLGLLNARSEWSGRTITVVTYWQSFEHLERYAHSACHAHRPAWTAFYRGAGASGGAVGLFHETFTVQPGTAESLYVDMPDDFGLGGAVGMVPIGGSLNAARERLDRLPEIGGPSRGLISGPPRSLALGEPCRGPREQLRDERRIGPDDAVWPNPA